MARGRKGRRALTKLIAFDEHLFSQSSRVALSFLFREASTVRYFPDACVLRDDVRFVISLPARKFKKKKKNNNKPKYNSAAVFCSPRHYTTLSVGDLSRPTLMSSCVLVSDVDTTGDATHSRVPRVSR